MSGLLCLGGPSKAAGGSILPVPLVLNLLNDPLFVDRRGDIGQRGPSASHFRRTEKDRQMRIPDAEPFQGNHDRVIPHQTGRKGDGYRHFA